MWTASSRRSGSGTCCWPGAWCPREGPSLQPESRWLRPRPACAGEVLHHPGDTAEFFYRDLVPGEHLVLVERLADLPALLRSLEQDPAKAQRIAAAGQAFAEQRLTEEGAHGARNEERRNGEGEERGPGSDSRMLTEEGPAASCLLPARPGLLRAAALGVRAGPHRVRGCRETRRETGGLGAMPAQLHPNKHGSTERTAEQGRYRLDTPEELVEAGFQDRTAEAETGLTSLSLVQVPDS